VISDKTTATDPVLYEVEDGVATISLNRPDRLNAWNRAMAAGFQVAVTRAAGDPDVRAMVLTGAGRGFCSGADFDLLDEAVAGEDVSGANNSILPTDLIAIPKPVVAAINGPAAGLGLVLALCCDIRFAAAGAKLTAVFPRLGLIAEYGSAWLLPRLAGTAVALDVLLSGRVIQAEEAERIGLVNRVLEPEALLAHAQAYARDLARNCSPSAMRTIKRQVYSGFESGLAPALQDSLRLMRESLQSDDFKEGIAANAEKRLPRFENVD
jgi:enoyl-CoA hydratase/carnithine racemase